MASKKIERGTIKVVWVSKNPKKIFSKMFNSLKEAEEFANKKKKSLIFQLVKYNNMRHFEWNILPYGKAKIYLKLLKRI